jgi:hypothetical protein
MSCAQTRRPNSAVVAVLLCSRTAFVIRSSLQLRRRSHDHAELTVIINAIVFPPYTIYLGFGIPLDNKSYCLGSTYVHVDFVVPHRGFIFNEQCRIAFFICVGFPTLGFSFEVFFNPFRLQITPVYNLAVGVRLYNLKSSERKFNV